MTQEELNQVAGVVTTLMKEKITELTSQFDAKIEALKPQTPAQQDTAEPTSQDTLPGIGALIGNPFDQTNKEQPNMTDITAQLSEQLKISQELNRKLIGSLNTPSPGTGTQQPKTAEEVLAAAIR